MGSSQSQASYDKDQPSYNYHEKVMTDAQTSISNCNTITTNSVTDSINGDEEYYSAEEGDSSCSLTPERTRPESSSAENSSDTSTGESDHDDDGNNDDYSTEDSTHSVSSSVPEEELLTSAGILSNNISVDADVASQQRYSQYTLQQHKCIGQKPENVKKSCNSFMSSSDRDVGFSKKNIIISHESQDRIVNFENLSPFIPILQPQELNGDKTASECKENFTSFNKKACLPSESQIDESICSLKEIYASGGLKQQGNGYIESSESESDELDKYKKRKSRKRRKMSSESQSRSRQRYRYSRNRRDSVSDSDEGSYGKRKCEENLMSRCDS